MYRISLMVFLCGCTIPLETAVAGVDASVSADTVVGCPLFAEASATLDSGRSFPNVQQGALWSFDDGKYGVVVRVQPEYVRCGVTPNEWSVALPATATDAAFARPLDVAQTEGGNWQFFETWRFAAGAPFGVKTIGRGIARLDAASGQFQRGPLFWTADRPNYGQAAIVDGGWLYAYGCSGSADGWSRDCYVARVPVGQISDINAWQYATGVGQFTANVDDAQPILTGVGDIEVRRHAAATPEPSGRLLLTYIKPLDTLLQVRSALGPTGPFSAPHVLGQCEASTGTFCVGAVQHPELDPDAATIAVTFARASFDPLPSDARWPRLAFLPLPGALP